VSELQRDDAGVGVVPQVGDAPGWRGQWGQI
jgi:hypothetical protein